MFVLMAFKYIRFKLLFLINDPCFSYYILEESAKNEAE